MIEHPWRYTLFQLKYSALQNCLDAMKLVPHQTVKIENHYCVYLPNNYFIIIIII